MLSDVTTKHIAANTGKEIGDAVVETYKEGDAYTTIAKDLVGYILTKSPEVPNGTMGREEIEVVYEYKMISDGLIVKYIDVNYNTEITQEVKQTLKEGDLYTTEEKSFEGYKLTSKTDNTSGVMARENIEVVYEYKKISAGVDVKFIDQVTGEEIADKEHQDGLEKDNYTTTPKTIENYELVKTPTNKNGEMTVELITVTYEYRKLSDVVEKYIDVTYNTEITP